MKAKPKLTPELLRQRRVERPAKARKNAWDTEVERLMEISEARSAWRILSSPGYDPDNCWHALKRFEWRRRVEKYGLMECTYIDFPNTGVRPGEIIPMTRRESQGVFAWLFG